MTQMLVQQNNQVINENKQKIIMAPFKMYGKSPMMKKLIGKQHNLPEALKAKIEASPMSQKSKFDISSDKKQVPLSPGEEKKGTMITGGSKSEEINDLEDRIEFLNSDISDSDSTTEKGKMTTQRNKLQARLKKMRAK